MANTLQALLDKIYQEGVAKGQEVATVMVRDAEKKAARILEEAEKEAADIRRQALEEAEELKRNVASELRLSAGQAISAVQQKINNLITTHAINQPVRASFGDQEFIKRMIETLVRNWDAGQNGQNHLSLLLPPQQEELNQYFSEKAKELMQGTLVIDFDHKLERGFRIGPADNRYVISFTDKDFEIFFMDYLRPKTIEILYGKNNGKT